MIHMEPEFALRKSTGLYGIGKIIEVAYVSRLLVALYLCGPLPLTFVPENTYRPRLVCPGGLHIHTISRATYFPQIDPAVIAPIAIYVIYELRLSPGHQYKSNAMYIQASSIHANTHVPIMGRVAGG